MATEKTLRELHHELMINALFDDLNINYSRKIVAVEMMANEFGWDCLASRASLGENIQTA
jgi:hypothetical protein